MGFNCAAGVGCCVLLVCFGLIMMSCGGICLLVVVSYLFGFVSLYSLLLVLRALLVAVFVVVYIWLCLLFAFWV